jgi:hypothetical protein
MDICNSIVARKVADPARAVAQRRQRGDSSFIDETLVLDSRAGLSPSQMVERKLAVLMKNAMLPISHMLTGDRATPRQLQPLRDNEKRWLGCQFEDQPTNTCKDKALVGPETEVFRGNEILGDIAEYAND